MKFIGEVFDGCGKRLGAGLRLEDGRLHEIVEKTSSDSFPARYIVPGFVDTHCHGGGENSFSDDYSAEQISSAIWAHRRKGTTAMLASLVSLADPLPQIASLLPFCETGELAGIHLEGPFISPDKCGAQNPSAIRDVNLVELESWLVAGGGWIKTVTLAPELSEALDAARLLHEYGARPSWGHTNASGAATRNILDRYFDLAGSAQTTTHLFNAMPPIGHRDPGPVRELIAAARNSKAYLELIADGIHVDLDLAQDVLEYAANAYLVTDSSAVTGGEPGAYKLGGLDVELRDGGCYLNGTNTLAGGSTTIADQFGLLARANRLPLARIIRAVCQTPARACGIENETGVTTSLKIGSRPNFVILDGNFQVLEVVREGELIDLGGEDRGADD